MTDRLRSDRDDLTGVIARRFEEFERTRALFGATERFAIDVTVDGPVGIVHFGDLHIDDPGCDLALLMKHLEFVKDLDYVFCGTVGDIQNNWAGRLVSKYADQSTTVKESWLLADFILSNFSWLYVVLGNHDVRMVGIHNPIEIMKSRIKGIVVAHGCGIDLHFPAGAVCRMMVRHDFRGYSMWNPTHALVRAAYLLSDDDILVCGHRHVAGYQLVERRGRLCHAIRVGSYKVFDDFAREKGFLGGNFSPCCMTVIDPERHGAVGFVKVFWELEEGVDYLKFIRRKGGFVC